MRISSNKENLYAAAIRIIQKNVEGFVRWNKIIEMAIDVPSLWESDFDFIDKARLMRNIPAAECLNDQSVWPIFAGALTHEHESWIRHCMMYLNMKKLA